VGGPLGDKNVESAILARAQDYFRTPGSPAFGLHEQAARLAFSDVLPTGAENPMLDFSGFVPKGAPVLGGHAPVSQAKPMSRKVVTKGKPAAGAVPAPAAAKAAPKPAGRPAGKSDQQLVEEANDAIKKGAPRDKVMERLKAWGVPLA
jgi:hypothetical protein